MAYVAYTVKDAQGEVLFINGIHRTGLRNYQFGLVFPEYYQGVDFDPEYLNMSDSDTLKLAQTVANVFKNTPFEILEVWGILEGGNEQERIL